MYATYTSSHVKENQGIDLNLEIKSYGSLLHPKTLAEMWWSLLPKEVLNCAFFSLDLVIYFYSLFFVLFYSDVSYYFLDISTIYGMEF
jgi:hypothetical protein